VREIQLANNLVTLVDEEDYELLLNFKWVAYKHRDTYYVMCWTKHRNVKMHRLLLGISNSKIHVDHINHNGLDNRKENLRLATAQQNNWNRRKRSGNVSSKYKGVTKLGASTWRASVYIKSKNVQLGDFPNEKMAALAYNIAALKYFGEFACVNSIL
jgi:hypothetical protein